MKNRPEPKRHPMQAEIKLTTGGVPVKNMAEMLMAVCRGYGISLEKIQSHNRSKMVVQARKVFAVRAYKECGASSTEIGVALGNRDHTTILHYLKTCDFKI